MLAGQQIRNADDTKYMVRWRFDFADKPTKVGFWGRAGDQKTGEGLAAFVNKEGLVRASIEGKDMNGGAIKTLIEVDGHDFCNFQWMAAAKYALGAGDQVCPMRLLGMKLISRDFEFWTFPTGLVHREPRTVEDKSFHYAGYGR